MLVRLIIENCYSFGERTEFNMLPRPKIQNHPTHVFNNKKIKLLRLSAIYGANASGKSNLIKSLSLLKSIVTKGELPGDLNRSKFKLDSRNHAQIIAIEFIQNQKSFYYALEFSGRSITTEELYILDYKKESSHLLFERKKDESKTLLKFNQAFDSDPKIEILKSIITEEFLSDNACALSLISKRNNKIFNEIKEAFSWVKDDLIIITPESKAAALPLRLEKDKNFKIFVNKILCAFDLGLSAIGSEKIDTEEFLKNQKSSSLEKFLRKSRKKQFLLVSGSGKEIVVEKNQDDFYIRQLFFDHESAQKEPVRFYYEDESDGTKRLIDLISLIYDIIHSPRVYIMDEIERSIHPLLIKEILKKLSEDSKIIGQLIFTTHEPILLDQDIFRQDEIWFVEKNIFGMSSLYPLSNYKEHKTIDVQKGYLQGRYGSIPVLSDLRDLTWDKNANSEQKN